MGLHPVVLLAAAGLPLVNPLALDVKSTDSIKDASATVAYGLMKWYQNNQSSTPATAIGTFAQPVYWWEAGAVWGGLIDYWAYTGDSSYNPTVTQALLAQVGPDDNYMPPAYNLQLGNDDQAFWAFACLAATEYNFPVPEGHSSSLWLDLAEAVFNSQVPRWDTSSCGGGLRWQIFSYNAGWTYKNTISNGGLFQIAARLYRYTGNQTYLDWAEKTWDWMADIGLINHDFVVFDGSSDAINCTQLDHTLWTYNPAVLIYGTAMLYSATGNDVWGSRTSGLVDSAAKHFFTPCNNSTNVMYEPSCEPTETCDTDQFSFKAYLSRWLSKSAVLYPAITTQVSTLLTASAQAAARSCSGPPETSGGSSTTCGAKWYTTGYDGSFGPGQELSALETIQSLLLLADEGGFVPRKGGVSSNPTPKPSPKPKPKTTLKLKPTTSTTSSVAVSSVVPASFSSVPVVSGSSSFSASQSQQPKTTTKTAKGHTTTAPLPTTTHKHGGGLPKAASKGHDNAGSRAVVGLGFGIWGLSVVMLVPGFFLGGDFLR